MAIIECTKEKPWYGNIGPDDRIRHHDVSQVGDQRDGWPGGDWVTYQCDNCGTKWESELPQ